MTSIGSINFHDSYLKKIELGENTTELLFELVTGKRVRLLLNEVERLLCNGFREGNIILEASIIGDLDRCDSLFSELFDKPAVDIEKHQVYLVSLKNRISKGELMLLHLTPSYGCELIALCRKIEFRS